MSDDVFVENVVGVAKNKLDKFNSLEEECSHLWGEILERRYDWEVHRNEALSLRSLTKKQVLEAFNTWLHPETKSRRKMSVYAIGTTEGQASIGRPVVTCSTKEMVDDSVKGFHKAGGNNTWGCMKWS